ncbi:Os05g0408950 [Oryza sativa Japonica Group]|uniref:Os05g0408950 protein n=1 Tax=Oryza sativa subsp. japonica TaxID=39947 RepID=A0A0P0WM60_ORYSJ|nr:Os05g0408950 [Oryza sativa Japonica Group]
MSSDIAWTVEDAAAGDKLRRETWTVVPPATTLWCPALDILQVSPSSDIAWTVEDAATGDKLRRETWTVVPPATTLWCPALDILQVSPNTW